MRRLFRAMSIAAGISALTACTTFVEKAEYRVLQADGDFELRAYPAQIVAETQVDSAMETAGDQAFQRLFDYISGENRSSREIDMTAPVTQSETSEEIAMTVPVTQTQNGANEARWRVAFIMPAEYTRENLPEPKDDAVQLREIPARSVAAVQYSGRWDEAGYRENLKALEDWIQAQGLTQAGEPVWARYNPPITPWFLRRNEVQIPVQFKRDAGG